MLRVGTSGYSFADWKGPVYPPTISNRDMLTYYARELKFNTVEINYTYYRQPSARTLSAMLAKVPEDFDFTIKAYREMTHDIFDEKWHIKDHPQAFKIYREEITPLVERDRLGCVLVQFPTAFFPKPENRDYILTCKERLSDVPLVIEFRHKAWARESTFQFLKENGLGYCCVDEPQLPKLVPFLPRITSPIAYFRFHGRNTNWFNVPASERYNYLYTDKELKEFVPAIKSAGATAEKTYCFFNNCHAGYAAKNALRIKSILGLSTTDRKVVRKEETKGTEQLDLFS